MTFVMPSATRRIAEMERYHTPILAQWDITTGCNFSCSFCLTNSGTKSKGELEYDKAELILNRLYDGGVLYLRILGGEPFFRSDINRVMRHAADQGMLISFSTNASLITETRANMLKEIEQSISYFQVSLYGIDQTSYEGLTNNSSGFQLVTEGVRNFRKANLRPYCFWVLTPQNIHQVESAYQLVRDWGLPVLRISPKLNLGRASKDSSEHLLIWQKAMDVFARLNELVIKNGSPQVQLHARPFLGEFLYRETGLPYFYITCKAASTMVYVDAKGDASPCPFAPFMPKEWKINFESPEKVSLLTHTLDQIWDSPIFLTYRKLQDPDQNPNGVFKRCPHLASGICNPCIYTPCTCRETIKMIKSRKADGRAHELDRSSFQERPRATAGL
jgi:MoaA/NifB/PqqE/SkfB family radical SAM enzyme